MQMNTVIPKAPAYWISPMGKVYCLFGEEKHIHLVIDYPELFELTPEEIKDIYEEEREALRTEGRARERIMLPLLTAGWIRIRRYMREDTFSVNVCSLSEKNKSFLYQWATSMADTGLEHSAVRIDLPGGQEKTAVKELCEKYKGGKSFPICIGTLSIS